MLTVSVHFFKLLVSRLSPFAVKLTNGLTYSGRSIVGLIRQLLEDFAHLLICSVLLDMIHKVGLTDRIIYAFYALIK